MKQMNLIATCFRKHFQGWVFIGYFPQGGGGVLLLEKLCGRARPADQNFDTLFMTDATGKVALNFMKGFC